jgi:hypothetical protein
MITARIWRVVALAFALLLTGATTASAAPAQDATRPAIDLPWSSGDPCPGPVPAVPGNSIADLYAPAPYYLPQPGDPFTPGAHTSIYEQYGLAGYTYVECDLDTSVIDKVNPVSHAGNSYQTWFAGTTTGIARWVVGFSAGMTYVAFNPTVWTGTFDKLITNGTAAIRSAVFGPFVPLAIAVAGVVMIWQAKRMRLSKAMTSLVMVVGCVAAAAIVFNAPTKFGNVADGVVAPTLGAINRVMNGQVGSSTADPSTEATATVVDAIFYRQWLQGTFGSADSQTAKTYGPRLFKDSTLSRVEAAQYAADPKGLGAKMIAAKRHDWSVASQEIKDSDPIAYDTLTGRDSAARARAGVTTAGLAFASAPFQLVSAFLVIICYLLVRLAVMVVPLAALVAVIPGMHSWIRKPVELAGAAVLNTLIFGAGTAFATKAMVVLVDPANHLPGWLGALLLFALYLLLWYSLKPFRRITRMVSGSYSPGRETGKTFGRLGRHLKRGLTTAGATYAGARFGAKAAMKDAQSDDDAPTDEREPAPYRMTFDRPETQPRHPELPPAPPRTQVFVEAHDLPRDQRYWNVPDQPAPAEASTAAPTVVDDSRAMPGAPERRSLPAGQSQQPEDDDVDGELFSPGTQLPEGAPTQPADQVESGSDVFVIYSATDDQFRTESTTGAGEETA